jgi:hypothetical protein
MNKVSVANFALSSLGEAPIQSLDDNNSRARICKARLDDVIRTVLRMHIWNGALQRQLLTRGTDPVYGFNYTYQLPSDCIKVVEVNPLSRFRVEKQLLLSNETKIYLLYVAEPDDITTLDALLAETIAMKLAVEIAETITSKDNLKNEMMQKFVIALQEARSANSKDNVPEHRERSSFLDAKLGRQVQNHRTFNTPTIGYAVDQEAWITKS